MVRLLPLAMMSLLSACNNPCQALCYDMAQYARECGYTSTANDLQSCRDSLVSESLAEGQQAECQEISDPETLREWWTCEELLDNYTSAAP